MGVWNMIPFIYLKALRHSDHTVFCVEDGQKTYYNPQFNARVPYSSGQQVKRSILEEICHSLGKPLSPVTYNYSISERERLENKEPWSTCDPTYVDQLIGGWMRAKSGEIPLKRRSPLSVSAMRPLHPLLANVTIENLTFDRSDNPDHHPVIVRDNNGNELSEKEINEFLQSTNRTLPRRHWIPEQRRAGGLFVYDVAIDMRTLFAVSVNQHEPELTTKMIEKLKSDGWIESKNIFGDCLVCPKNEREKYIEKIAHALFNWRITSNQARTFSPMETLAVAVSDNANKVSGAIRAQLNEDTSRLSAKPIIDESSGAKIFIALPCDGYVVGAKGSAEALDKAEEEIKNQLLAFDYEKQV